jgi:glutamate/tyrosine decarboxylase-like PLP-dependent enzyme
VLEELDRYGRPATVANAGGRYFGFVMGGGLPASVAAHYLASAWNQNSAVAVMSPVAARLEAVALGWIRELLELPEGARGAFVSGDTLANVAALAAARHEVLARAGWDVEQRGLSGAPPVRIVVGEEVHVSVLRALALVGFGRDAIHRVPTDAQGRMRADALPPLTGPTIVCLQAGNVNTGAFDPAREIAERAHAAGAWVHVDGAFGLWARVAPRRRALVDGIELADSWALDGHKWLNVPYDSGLVFVRDGRPLREAMAGGPAAYLPSGGEGEAMEYTPEMSRRARGIDAWAALRALGRSGLAELVERCCRLAARSADRLREGGARILNEVVLNQVLVDFGDAERTRRTIEAVQEEGTAWCGGTVWHGTAAMRISVSSWATTESDIDRAVGAILRLADRPARG